MNVAAYLQERQYGFHRMNGSRKSVDVYLESKLTESFVNKPCEISGRCRSTFVMQFSPDGTKVASTHGDHSVQVSDIATGKLVRTLEGHPRTPWCLAYHPSSSHILASGCLGGQVRIWDLYGHGCEVWETENSTVVASLTFHPVDHVLVIAAGNTLYFWDWSKPEPFATCRTKHEYERIRWVKFDSRGNTLFTGICNSVSIQREHAYQATYNSEEVPTTSGPSGQPHQLSSVYNNIVNYYQEYRRDRLLNQIRVSRPGVHSTGTLRPSVAGSTGGLSTSSSDPYLSSSTGFTGMRELSAPGGIGAPASLEFQAQADSMGGPDGTGNSAFAPRFLVPPMRGLTSPPPVRQQSDNTTADSAITTDVEITLDSIIRNVQAVTTEGLARLSHSVVSTDSISPMMTEPSHSGGTGQLSSSVLSSLGANADLPGLDDQATATHIPTLPSIPIPLSTSISQNSLSVLVSQYLQNQISSASTVSSAASNTNTATRASLGASAKPFQSIRERLQSSTPLTIINTESISSQGTNVHSQAKGIPKVTVIMSTTSQPTSKISVASGNSATNDYPKADKSKKVGSTASQVGGAIPKVTILPSSSYRAAAELYNTSLFKSGTGSNMKTSSASNVANNATISGTNNELSPIRLSVSCALRMSRNLQQRNSAESATEVISGAGSESARSNVCVATTTNVGIDCISSIGISSSSVTPVTVPSAISTPSALPVNVTQENDENPSVVNSIPVGLESLSTRMGHTTGARGGVGPTGLVDLIRSYSAEPDVSESTGTSSSGHVSSLSDSSLYPDSHLLQEMSSVGPSRLSASQLSGLTYPRQPYSLPNRSRYMPLMGPYLASRGINPVSCLPSSTVLEESTHDIPMMSADNSQELARAGSANVNQHSREASSDTDTELSAHLSTSGAYFLPITEDQRHTLSSASLNRNTDSAVLRQFSTSAGSTDSVQGQSSRSSSQSQDIELVVDQNDNYATTSRPGVSSASDTRAQAISLRNHDSNNNSIHIVTTSSAATTGLSAIPTSLEDRNQDYMRLRDSFVSMTDQIEREMSALNRRINALRDSFNQSIRSLRHDRRRYENVDTLVAGSNMSSWPATDPVAGASLVSTSRSMTDAEAPMMRTQPPTLLESVTNGHLLHSTSARMPGIRRGAGSDARDDHHNWRQLHRHYLHPHYSSSILDDTVNRPNNAIQSAINRAIAGAFMGTGEPAVANNIINQTHRIQAWDFTKCDIPDITLDTINILVPHCKLHNDASADIAQTDTKLATFVPSHQGFPDDNILAVYSLEAHNRGQCLYTKKFGPNAISVSISPSCNYILVGLAAKRLSWVFAARQMVAQVYKLEKLQGGEKSMKHVKDVMHICRTEVRTNVSGNSARWLPLPGQGIVYGTNRGDLNICRPGVKVVVGKSDESGVEVNPEASTSDSRILRVAWLYYNPRRVSAGTQTAGVRRTAGTQTEQSDNEEEHFV